MHTILADAHEDPIDVGRLISNNINALVNFFVTVFGHIMILNSLWDKYEVLYKESDVWDKSKWPMNKTYFNRLIQAVPPPPRAKDQHDQPIEKYK